MSYTAARFPASVRFAPSLKEALFEEGFDCDGRSLIELPGTVDSRELSLSMAQQLPAMSQKEFDIFVDPLYPGARYVARIIKNQYSYQSGVSSEQFQYLFKDWAAIKGIRKFLEGKDQSVEVRAGNLVYGLNIRYAWQAERFWRLWEKLRVESRVWDSCYQANKIGMRNLALCPNYNNLPLWVKKVLIENGKVCPSRPGDIWKLIPAAKAWKVCPDLPKAIAVRIGKMPLWKRIAAKLAWENPSERFYERQDMQNQFWFDFDFLCRQGMNAVLVQSGDYARTISIKFPTINIEIRKILAAACKEQIIDVKFLMSFKIGAFQKAVNSEEFAIDFDLLLGKMKNLCGSLNSRWQFKSLIGLIATFKNEWQRWLSNRVDIHDATFWLPIATSTKLEGLSTWLFKNEKLGRMEEIKLVAVKWQFLSAEERSLPYKQLVAVCQAARFEGQKNIDFAIEAAKWGVSSRDYPDFEARFISYLNVPSPFPLDKGWEYEGIVGRFLPRNDVRGLFLGHYTNCCQHPTGQGASCAWYGQGSKNSGFFVWEKEGEVVAQSWCWVTEEGLCFDNVEAKGLRDRHGAVAQILEMTANDLAHFGKVTVGLGLSDLVIPETWEKCEKLNPPEDYRGYVDSDRQVLVCEGVRKIKESAAPTVWVRVGDENDIPQCEAIAQQCYPCGWQNAGGDEDDCGLVLESAEGILGYATFEMDNRYISDIAVLPQHRNHSMLLVNAVLNFCQHYGGSWSCDARESTSFKLLSLLHKRKKILILSSAEDGWMRSERMFKLVFEVL